MKKLYSLFLLGVASLTTHAQQVSDVNRLAGNWQFTVKEVTEASSWGISTEDEQLMTFNAEVQGTNTLVFTGVDNPDIILTATFADNELTFEQTELGQIEGSYVGLCAWVLNTSGTPIATLVSGYVNSTDYTFHISGFKNSLVAPGWQSGTDFTWGFLKNTFNSSYTSTTVSNAPNAYFMYSIINMEKIATIEVDDITFEQTPENNPTQAEITITGVSATAKNGSPVNSNNINVTYQLNDEEPVAMEMTSSGNYSATIVYSELEPGNTYSVSVKIVATSLSEPIAVYEKDSIGTFTVNVYSLSIGKVSVIETPEGAPTQAVITVRDITGSNIDDSDLLVTYRLNGQGDPKPMTNEGATYTATLIYADMEPGTYVANISVIASIDGEEVASAQMDSRSFIVPESSNGLYDITAGEKETARYYNLEGVEVRNPSNGIFIKVVDGKATKVKM